MAVARSRASSMPPLPHGPRATRRAARSSGVRAYQSTIGPKVPEVRRSMDSPSSSTPSFTSSPASAGKNSTV